jgi:hypothetical protein
MSSATKSKSAQPQPIGSPDDIIIYNGRVHSRAYALADFAAAQVPSPMVEQYMAQAPVIFAQPSSGAPVFFMNKCHGPDGRFAPCDSEAAEAGAKAKGERDKKKAEDKEAKTKTKAEKIAADKAAKAAKDKAKADVAKIKDKTERKAARAALAAQNKKEKALKTAAREVRSIVKEKTFPPPQGAPSTPSAPSAEASRVGVPGMVVPPPPDQIPRVPNLTAAERLVEERFASAFEKDPDGIAGKYLEGVLKGHEAVLKSGKPSIPKFETDDAKMMSGDWRGDGLSAKEAKDNKGLYNVALHQTANAICKRAFVQYLDKIKDMPPEKRNVLVTSGGCGAGKGYALKNAPGASDVSKSVSATWDAAGEQNATENAWILKECKDRGIKPTFAFVHADPTETWENPKGGVVYRADGTPKDPGTGRMVDARLFVDSYVEGAKNFKDFMDANKDSGDANFLLLDNSVRGTNPDGSPIMPKIIDKIPDSAFTIDPEKLYARSSNYLAGATEASAATRRGGSVGGRIWPQKAA